MIRLALDHLTAVDTTPIQLAQAARAAGCDGLGLFLTSLEVLPLMPRFDLCGDPVACRATRAIMGDLGLTLDLAYPFTLTGRSEFADFSPAMACAAELGAGLVNVLVYDRDPARRLERFGQFCDAAAGFGLGVAVEFYPPSGVPSLGAAVALVEAIGRPGQVGINADLLHLMRSGGTLAELAQAPAGTILYGQVSDGPAAPPSDPEAEASSARLLCGDGAFDITGFVRALPSGCPVSVEIPCDLRVPCESALARSQRAAASARALLG